MHPDLRFSRPAGSPDMHLLRLDVGKAGLAGRFEDTRDGRPARELDGAPSAPAARLQDSGSG